MQFWAWNSKGRNFTKNKPDDRIMDCKMTNRVTGHGMPEMAGSRGKEMWQYRTGCKHPFGTIKRAGNLLGFEKMMELMAGACMKTEFSDSLGQTVRKHEII